jgi:hypothetical protein
MQLHQQIADFEAGRKVGNFVDPKARGRPAEGHDRLRADLTGKVFWISLQP